MEWGKMEVGYWKDSEDGWAVLKIGINTGATFDPEGQSFWTDYDFNDEMGDKLVWLGYVAKGLC